MRLGEGFTRLRVERLLGLSMGLACIVFGVQAALTATAPPETGAWHIPLLIIAFGALAVLVVTGIIGRGFRFAAGLYACAYIVVLIIWLFAGTHNGVNPVHQAWIWYLVNIATIGAAIAFPFWVGFAFTVLLPVAYAGVRIAQGNGASEFWIANIADNSFSLFFGLVLFVLVWILRTVADGVDRTRLAALEAYGHAAAQDAADQERVAIAALMHDSVLSALLAAERAESQRERQLATAMAKDALSGLANAETSNVTGTDEPVSARVLARSIADAAASSGLTLHIETPEDYAVPDSVARAMQLAATQAIMNSVQHANAVGLSVSVHAEEDGCTIVVHDDGPGIDNVAQIPEDRLGLRGSIFARMAAVGGVAELETQRGGTTITLRWRR